MNTSPRRRANYRRKIHYVDETLQRSLLLGLVLLEAALAIGLTWLMWQYLNQIVDDSLYRVHLAQAVPMLPQLAREALILLGLFFAVNLTALLLVDLLWRRYVNSILRLFIQLTKRTAALDFRADPEVAGRHQVLDLTESQRDQDRRRLVEFRLRLKALAALLLAPGNTATTAGQLQALQQLLPQTPENPAAPKTPPLRRLGDTL